MNTVGYCDIISLLQYKNAVIGIYSNNHGDFFRDIAEIRILPWTPALLWP